MEAAGTGWVPGQPALHGPHAPACLQQTLYTKHTVPHHGRCWRQEHSPQGWLRGSVRPPGSWSNSHFEFSFSETSLGPLYTPNAGCALRERHRSLPLGRWPIPVPGWGHSPCHWNLSCRWRLWHTDPALLCTHHCPPPAVPPNTVPTLVPYPLAAPSVQAEQEKLLEPSSREFEEFFPPFLKH